ncbi:MAG: hypothetical protein OHK0023_20250 [Anaerolineae bacterium]
MKLFYLANIRMPTEKAHGLQIMQNCEAFAAHGTQVTLFVARRFNTAAFRQVRDVWDHYGVAKTFAVCRVPCLDLFPILERFSGRLAFALQTISYLMALCLILLFRRADVYYSRDPLTLLVLSAFLPRRKLAYEAHALVNSRLGGWMQGIVARRCGVVVAVTAHLAQKLRERGGIERVNAMTEHDGFRAERFANLPDQSSARQQLNLPQDAFLVGYVGRLHTMSMSKGVDTLVDAIAVTQRPMGLCLLGGPDDMAEQLRARWQSLGLPTENFRYLGQVKAADVPLRLAALDVCAMPLPFTEHFAYYASPLKLFEYLAAGKAIVASDLPGTAEVVRHGESALLTPPSDVTALAQALQRLYDHAEVRQQLAQQARRLADHYTWQARAKRILAAVEATQ